MVGRKIGKKTQIIVSSILLILIVVQVDCQCDGSTLTLPANTTAQTFSTPNFETTGYPENSDCKWLILAPVDYKISLQFKNIRAPCDSAAVTAYNGVTTADTVIEQNPICAAGGISSSVYWSSGHNVLVSFTSASANGQGLEIYYMAGKDFSGSGCTSQQTLLASSIQQILTSANFPSEYNSDDSCIWTITADGGATQVELVFLLIDIEDDVLCQFDSLQLFDGSTTSDSPLANAKICGEAVWTVTKYASTGQSVTIQFISDDGYQKVGFLLKYRSIGYLTTTTTTTTTTKTKTTTKTTTTTTTTNNAAETTTIYADNSATIAAITCGIVLTMIMMVTFIVVYLKMKGNLPSSSSNSVQVAGQHTIMKPAK